ncbi:MAG: hypothetical protein WDM77_01920, partial [Steroidobacteraceae bacterium]
MLNGGTLSSPEGQVLLAAGQNVYLAASSEPGLRGLLVAVDDAGLSSSGMAISQSTGQIVNQSAGQISAAHGNVTLAALMVNQEGRISATTSVSANGSVVLQGGDGYDFGSQVTTPTQGGTVELAAGSDIAVLPDLSDTTTAVAAQQQLQSTVAITGPAGP